MLENIEKLIEEKKYSEIKKQLIIMNEHDIAEILEELPSKEMVKLFRLLPKDLAAEVFAYFETDTQTSIITSLSDAEAVNIIEEMATDDATDLIDEMPSNVVTRLLAKVNKETRRDINQLLKYPDNSAGSLMTVEYVDFKEYITIKDAIKKIKREYDDKETLDICYITDKARKLVGYIELKDLLINNEDKTVGEIMDTDVISVNTLTDQEEVARIIKEYDLNSIAVVDLEQKIVGIITIDDVIDIIDEETTEDIEKMNAILPTEKSYLKLSIFDIWKSRIPWLLLLMVSATFTGKIIEHYEESLATMVILTAFIPMIMDTGGNCGSQASTLVIRGLAIDEIEPKDFLKVIFKELFVAIGVGIILAVANGIRIMIQYKDIKLSITLGITLILTTIMAKLIGGILPIVAKRLKLDPAIMAAPLITTIVDTCAVFAFFNVAVAVMGL